MQMLNNETISRKELSIIAFKNESIRKINMIQNLMFSFACIVIKHLCNCI